MARTTDNIKGSVILCSAALIWGLAFVAQSDASESVPPFLFNSVRSLIGSFSLFVILVIRKLCAKKPIRCETVRERNRTWLAGLFCGLLLTLSVNLQQFGITVYPDGAAVEARGGFLTALYVVIVPVLSLIKGKKVPIPVWLAVGLAAGGTYLLCLHGGLTSIYLGDILMLLCALSFSFHILTIDRYGKTTDGIRLSAIQFLTCGVISGVFSLIGESFVWENVVSALPAILYVGILSSGVAYTMQIFGQRYADPPIASLSMSLESVFAALGGWIILHNRLSVSEFFGCSLVFLAIILAQIPSFPKKKPEPDPGVESNSVKEKQP